MDSSFEVDDDDEDDDDEGVVPSVNITRDSTTDVDTELLPEKHCISDAVLEPMISSPTSAIVVGEVSPSPSPSSASTDASNGEAESSSLHTAAATSACPTLLISEARARLSRKRDLGDCDEDTIPEQEACEFDQPASPSRPFTPEPWKRARASPLQHPPSSGSDNSGNECW